MGIFSGSMTNTVDSIIDVQEATGYEDISGVQEAMLESYENQYKMFEGTIISDIQEAQMRANETDEDDILTFSEGVISDLIDKLKEFFKKLWSKIKAIFRAFMAKIDSVFMKSNKEFVNKYKNEVLRKDLTDFEVKYRKRTSKYLDFNDKVALNGKIDPTGLWYKNNMKQLTEAIDNFDTNDETCNFINEIFSGMNISEVKEFDKEIMDHNFEDSEIDEYKDVNGLMNELINFKTTKKGLDDNVKKATKWINDIVKKLDKEENEVVKKMPVKDNERIGHKLLRLNTSTSGASLEKDQNESTPSGVYFREYQKAVRLSSMYANCLQTAITKATGGLLKVAKFDNAQNRRIFAAMVAYRKKSEDTLFTEAFMDLAEYEADCIGVY